MRCDICGIECGQLVLVETTAKAARGRPMARVCSRCLTYRTLRALVSGGRAGAEDLAPVA